MHGVVALVEAAKGSSGRSMRELAADASVAVSTITRIKRGTADPTVDTLARILDSAGFELQLVAVRKGQAVGPKLGDLALAWSLRRGRVHPEWTRWRALLDQLALEPDRIAEAIYPPPPPAGHPAIDALLAVVAEKLADDAALRRPSWTAAIPPLPEPWQPPSRVDRHDVPHQFAARGVIVDVASLWREPATVGV